MNWCSRLRLRAIITFLIKYNSNIFNQRLTAQGMVK
jgi:hypothetical protein